MIEEVHEHKRTKKVAIIEELEVEGLIRPVRVIFDPECPCCFVPKELINEKVTQVLTMPMNEVGLYK